MLLSFLVILASIVVKWEQFVSRDVFICLDFCFYFIVVLPEVTRLFDNMVFLLIPHHLVNLILKAPVEAIEAFVLVRRSRALVQFILKD